jgi:hypothetical protein
MSGVDTDFIVRDLAMRMQRSADRKQGRTPGVVFVLGAGCSMQYQFPGFTELLTRVHEYYHGPLPRPGLDDAAVDEIVQRIGKDPEEGREYAFDKVHEAQSRRPFGFEDLRASVDQIWKIHGPFGRRERLSGHFPRASGADCPAYLRLADLAERHFVTAIVNLNFDSLLDQALERIQGLRGSKAPFWHYPEPASSGAPQGAPKKPAGAVEIYAPHGMLSPRSSSGDALEPQLDIAESGLFKGDTERKHTEGLLTQNHVVIIGYSGKDAKLAQVLMGDEKDGKDRKLYVINVEGAGSLLPEILRSRRSEGLVVSGSDGTFESFLEQLYGEISRPPEEPPRADSPVQAEPMIELHASRSERLALAACRDLANRVRSSLGGSEAEPGLLETHAGEIFDKCLHLATAAGLSLTPPEKFVLHAAGYLHDLGHFWGWSTLANTEHGGYELLNTHGTRTLRLLKTGFLWPLPDSPEEPWGADRPKLTPWSALVPSAYTGESQRKLFGHLMSVCERHTSAEQSGASWILPEPPAQDDVRMTADVVARVEPDSRPATAPETAGIEFDLLFRPRLVTALFAAAEQLSGDHGFFVSKDPVIPQAQRYLQEIDDPILELCQQRERPFECEFRPWTVVAKNAGSPHAKRAPAAGEKLREWQLTRAKLAIDRLNVAISELPPAPPGEGEAATPRSARAGRKRRGKLQLLTGGRDSAPWTDPNAGSDRTAAVAAVGEVLETAMGRRSGQTLARTSSMLDLLAIYTLPAWPEPRVDLSQIRGYVAAIEDHVETRHRIPYTGVLYHHFVRSSDLRARYPVLIDHFRCDFEEILYPSWRFCGKSWRRGIDKINMARASLDFGSTLAREELVPGLHHLFPSTLHEAEAPYSGLCAHRGCIACTSRLLYILVRVKKLIVEDAKFDDLSFARPDQKEVWRIDDLIAAILEFLLSDKLEDFDWFGLAYDRKLKKDGRSRILSARYLAWAVRALALFVNFDAELKEVAETARPSYEPWRRKISPETVTAVAARLAELWTLLVGQENLVQPPRIDGNSWKPESRFEEASEYVLGDVALAYLFIKRLHHLKGRFNPPESTLDTLEKGLSDLGFPQLHDLGRFYAWPALFLLEEREGSPELSVDTYVRCAIDNPIWIRDEPDKGSWGYNVEPSQRVATSLTDFWRHVLDSEETCARYETLFKARPDLRDGRARRK